MHKKSDIIPLKELNLTDRFLFDEVMERPEAHQAALGIIFGREIPLLDKNESEKEFRVSPELRAIRMDIYAVDAEGIVYNTEMQKKRQTDLARRSRYYQSMVDTSLLESGVPDYNLLNETYIIMIMPFDLFGYGKYRYTFRPTCDEVPELQLSDGAVRIFLNTCGTNDDEVSKELVEFLHYVENTTDEAAEQAESPLVKAIHEHVRKVKSSEEAGVKYMQAWEEKYYDKKEAREEGLQKGREIGLREGQQLGLQEGKQVATAKYNALVKALAKDNRLDLLVDAADDAKLLQRLYEEYGIL